MAGAGDAGTSAGPKPVRTFTCLHCNRPFEFPYRTGPKPVFCSRSCQEKHRYQSKREAAAAREPGKPPGGEDPQRGGDQPRPSRASIRQARKLERSAFPAGRLPPGLEEYLEPRIITCARCGRPLGPEEGLDRWRVRVSSGARGQLPHFWLICPAHYGE